MLFLFSAYVSFSLSLYFSTKIIHLSVFLALKAIMPSLLIAVLMYIFLWLSEFYIQDDHEELIIKIILGVVVYLLMNVIFKPIAYTDLIDTIKTHFFKNRS